MNSRERSKQMMQHLDEVQNQPHYWFESSYQLLDDQGKGVDAFILEAYKSWHEQGEYRQTSVTLDLLEGQEGTQRLDVEAARLNSLQQTEGLESAMHEAERLAVTRGWLQAEREDSRFFTEGPPDPFLSLREHQLNTITDTQTLPAVDYATLYRDHQAAVEQKREANAHLEGANWFEAMFEGQPLLEPLHDTVNYAVVMRDVDPWTMELAVEKYWKGDNGQIGSDWRPLQTFDPLSEADREKAEATQQSLLEVYDERGLQAMMHQAELTAIENMWFDSQSFEGRLFRDGPPDCFTTLAQQLADEINPFWNTDGEKIEAPQTEWRLESLPVETPEGEPLGHALYCIRESEQEIQRLEMAHFHTREEVGDFARTFREYLLPGVIDGPELAEEVARLEGLPPDWQTLEGQDLDAYRNNRLTVIHEPAEWHPYNPDAERDARISAEGFYADPLQSLSEETPDLDF